MTVATERILSQLRTGLLLALSRSDLEMTDLEKSAESAVSERPRLVGCTGLWNHPEAVVPREMILLILVSGFLLLYGLVPAFGGDQLGLVGADEPRYAQNRREMLEAHSAVCHAVKRQIFPRSLRLRDLEASYHCLAGGTVTPILYGQPWLEKPALYYWRAMGFFKGVRRFGLVARLPSSSGAFALIALIFLHMRRFRPGGHLDAALITASCVGIVSFARGASTDMQLAAPFCIGMLGWYAWL